MGVLRFAKRRRRGAAGAPDITAPTISSTSPADNATGVADTVSPTITFSENVVFGTGLITLRENNGGWADLETFDVQTEVGTGNGQVSISGAVLTINPTASLTASREYAIRIAATAIDDTSGNSFAGVANDTTISFTVASLEAPAISGVSYNSGTEELTFTVAGTEPMTWYYVSLLDGTPAPSAATIKATPDGSGPVAAGINYIDPIDTPSTPGTYDFYFVVSNAAGDNVETITYTVVAPPSRVFTETWSAYTAGDTQVQLDAGGYTLGSVNPTALVSADANGPAGKAVAFTAATGSIRQLHRADVAADLALGGWSSVEVLLKLRTVSVTGVRGGVGRWISTTQASGLATGRLAGGTYYSLKVDADFNTGGPTSLATDLADNTVHWVRMRFSATDKLDGKSWPDGGSEPGSWSAQLTSAVPWAGNLPFIGILGRVVGGPCINILGYSVGIDATAPGF